MQKWYNNLDINNEIIISSRVRLARNFKDFPFNNFLNSESSNLLIKNVKDFVINERTNLSAIFNFINIAEIPEIEKLSMLEKNLLSRELIYKEHPTAALINNEESIIIMINEEDHIRIQSIFSGYNIDKAFKEANRIDDLIEETSEYAFDNEYGYLTSCITNSGTGLRASFMIHIPMLEKYGQFNKIFQELAKFGFTIRGIYGEGSKSLGGIYQISNQVTLGKSENEIIEDLKYISLQIAEKELLLRNKIIAKNKIAFIDKVYRSYGILSNCKTISINEAINHLSNIWLGISTKILDGKLRLSSSIYNIIINCQPASLSKNFEEIKISENLNFYRAKYLNSVIL